MRPYFPLPRVLAGMFAVAEKLYGVRIAERSGVDLYHPTSASTTSSTPMAHSAAASMSICTRAPRSAAAVMDECIGRKQLANTASLPVAYLVCNFMPPTARALAPDARRSRDDVPRVRPRPAPHAHVGRLPEHRGINGVAWDAVELPSQFMENFAWRAEVLPLISGHVETGEPLPQIELERLLATRTSRRACRQCDSWNSRYSICASIARSSAVERHDHAHARRCPRAGRGGTPAGVQSFST